MRRTFIRNAALLAVSAMTASVMQAASPPAAAPAAAARPAPLVVESKAFEDGGIVPLKFSLYGTNTQPDFKLTNVAPNAQSIAIIFHDLDVASGGNPDDNLHWMAWNIPVSNGTAILEEGKLPDGAVSRGSRGPGPYTGMGAPNGPRYHHYVFEFYALSAKLDLPATAGRPEVLEAMKGKVVGKAAYVGRFRNDTNAPFPRPAGPPAAPPAAAPVPGGA